MTQLLNIEKIDHYAVITINNPPMNVISNGVFKELDKAFQELGNDEKVNAVIITGQGEKIFAAGADIKEFPQLIGKQGIKKEFLETHAVLNRIDHFEKPVIAMLNGLTLGGGFEVALCCDIRIAEEHAQIGLPEITLGLFPGGGGTQRLPRLVGEAKAKELMFTGEAVSAVEAERIGLVNKVAASGEGLETARKMANRIGRFSLPALSRIKKAVDQGLELPLDQGIDLEAELFEEVFQTEDVQEGVKAFIEKRKPAFQNR
ncbi:enoyl-CoA hydratase/isomerase family protein [Planococcus shenhongbingii]|uniref:Enoyl-CoA hydratase n=1 Tax=Planococcus shenhongbingii TaxID=3058398 RepID=A0ABT8NG23_9BACL|nr:enoyl-CoA hydratase [Planococcus sp. N017]MDN7246728.1 enoyl-CoA hydratase [Planococcus sp. N017]